MKLPEMWFKRKSAKETKKCGNCEKRAKSNKAKYCIDCSEKIRTERQNKRKRK